MGLWLNMVILLMLLAGSYFGFVAVEKPNVFGFKGLSFYYYGRRIWKFTNRLFGLLLIIGSSVFFVRHFRQPHLLTPTEGSKQIGLLLMFLVLAYVTTDILAFIIMYQKKKKRKIKQF